VRRRLTCAAVLAAACCALAASGCAGDDASAPAPGTVRVGEFSWSSASLTNEILEQVVKRHPELGVRRLERERVAPEEGWSDLADGRLDLLTEVYLPNQAEFLERGGADTELVHRVYAGAVNGWFVPNYAVAPGGRAEGLTSVDQLDRYADAFDGKLYDGEDGWVTTEWNADRIDGFGLDLDQVTDTESELVAALRRAYTDRRPILLYLWRPHWAHSAFDLVMLDEPNGYSGDCFTGARKACAMPTNDSWTAGRTDLGTRLPRFRRFLGGFQIDLAEMERMLLEVDEKRAPAEAVAARWVERHRAEVAAWIGG
jgi:glycine betaine/proline transport system substrate-binding protein